MSTASIVRTGLLATVLGVAVQPASAQYEAFVPIDVMGTAMSGAIIEAARNRGEDRLAQSPAASAISPEDGGRFDYEVSPARSQANLQSFVAEARKADPKGAAGMQQVFATTDVLVLMDGEMRKVGLRRTNLADAYAVWWVNAWLGTRGRLDTPTREQMKAVRGQAIVALSQVTQLATTTDADRQELAESLLLHAMLISAAVEVAAEQPDKMPATREAIAKGAQATGLDLVAMTLTDDGFATLP